eukprot:CAMPEP_0194346532 /NCGR_PEP_ID=MMETSP0171-20130528/105478_1 /TAXON_ID=218684 /ORGANISM="Corethron pennatum, Strain L29A3" /LENGTH=663 /DNA_ID=CAMNT_0039113667 /DNA_START=847 /DNA_END=2838 /DNA_ORIENTATION=-
MTKSIKDTCFQNKKYSFKQLDLIIQYSEQRSQKATIEVSGFLNFFSEDEDLINSVEIPTFYVDGCITGLFKGESLEVYKSFLKNSGSNDLEKISEIQVGKKEEKTPSVEISLVPSQKPTSKPTKVPANEPNTQKLTPEPSQKTTSKPNKAPANESTTPQPTPEDTPQPTPEDTPKPTPEETADPRIKSAPFSEFSITLSLESYDPIGLLEIMESQTLSYMDESIRSSCFLGQKYAFKQINLEMLYSQRTSQEVTIDVNGLLDFFSEDVDLINSVEIPTFYVDGCITGLFKGESLEVYKSFLKNSGSNDLEKISEIQVGKKEEKTPSVEISLVPSQKPTSKPKKPKIPKRCDNVDKPKKPKIPKQCENVEQVWAPDIPTPTVNPDPVDINKCVGALLQSGFDIFKTDDYDKWLSDDSMMSLVTTGFYKGVDSITEYVNLIYDKTIFPEYRESLQVSDIPNFPPFVPILADKGNMCAFTFGAINSMKTSAESGNSVSMDRITGFRLQFTVLGATEIHMDRIELYYTRSFLKFLFGEVLSTKFYAESICKIFRDSCSSTFEKHCYQDLESCVHEIMELNGTDSSGAIDGKSIGCRILHSSYAAKNKAHCPHISYIPEYDTDCKLKCQHTSNKKDEDFFLPRELEYFKALSQTIGLGEEGWRSPSTL